MQPDDYRALLRIMHRTDRTAGDPAKRKAALDALRRLREMPAAPPAPLGSPRLRRQRNRY